jgi:hypothetical protein
MPSSCCVVNCVNFETNFVSASSAGSYEERKKFVPRKIKKLKKDAVSTLFEYCSSDSAPLKKKRRLLNRSPIPTLTSQHLNEVPSENGSSGTDSAPETADVDVKSRTKAVQVNG